MGMQLCNAVMLIDSAKDALPCPTHICTFTHVRTRLTRFRLTHPPTLHLRRARCCSRRRGCGPSSLSMWLVIPPANMTRVHMHVYECYVTAMVGVLVLLVGCQVSKRASDLIKQAALESKAMSTCSMMRTNHYVLIDCMPDPDPIDLFCLPRCYLLYAGRVPVYRITSKLYCAIALVVSDANLKNNLSSNPNRNQNKILNKSPTTTCSTPTVAPAQPSRMRRRLVLVLYDVVSWDTIV